MKWSYYDNTLTGHKKFPKGPPFAYIFQKISKKIIKGALTGHKKFPKGPPFAYIFQKISKKNLSKGLWRAIRNFQRVPPLLKFFKKFQKKLSKGEILAFPPSVKCATAVLFGFVFLNLLDFWWRTDQENCWIFLSPTAKFNEQITAVRYRHKNSLINSV